MGVRIRWLVGGAIVAVFVAAAFVFGSGQGVDDRGAVVALPTRAPATREPADRTFVAELLARLPDMLTAEARDPWMNPADITVHSYAEAEAILGWRMLQHPDDHAPDLRISGRTGGVFDAVEYSVLVGGKLVQVSERWRFWWVDDDDAYRSRVEVGRFDVTLHREYDNSVSATFLTGETWRGFDVEAHVAGPDVSSVVDFISELTFRGDD